MATFTSAKPKPPKKASPVDKELDSGKKLSAPKKTAKTETLAQFKRRLKTMSKQEMLDEFETLLEDEEF